MVLNKRGLSVVAGLVIFLVLNLIFLVAIFLAISRVEIGAPLYEEAYAKQIGLLLDGAKKGTIINVDLSELYQIGQKNNLKPVVSLDCERNEVFVQVTRGKGYRYQFFTDLEDCPHSYSIDEQKRKLTVRV